MLILSRVPGEKALITHEPTGETITVYVCKTHGKRAYIGFKAGKNFSIVRSEVLGDDFQELIFEPHQPPSLPEKEESHASRETTSTSSHRSPQRSGDR